MTAPPLDTTRYARSLALFVVIGLAAAGGYVATGQRWFEVASFAFACGAMFCAGVILSRDVHR